MSAFDNTREGMLILGLDESSGFRPAEGFLPGKVIDQFIDGTGDAGGPSRLTNPPRYELTKGVVDGTPVVVVEVAENDAASKPCSVTAKGVVGGSYKRVHDKDIKLSIAEVHELQQALRPQESDRQVVAEADVSDLDERSIDELLQEQSGARVLQGVSSRAEQLVRLNVLSKEQGVRLAGLLTVGRYPQQYFPRLFIDVTVHPANEKSPPNSGVRFIDRVMCDGPLTESIDAAVRAVTRNLRTYSVVEGTARKDQLEIPVEVLREAIANAAVHREYHELFLGQPVTVDIYPDRVVIANPGGLWGGKTVENIDDGSSMCRNRTLMQLLQAIPFRNGVGPTVEGQGGGVKLMIHEMEAHALDRPLFRANADQVTVTLRRHGAEVPAHRAWLRDLGDRQFTSQEDAALVMAKRHGHVSVERFHHDMRMDSDDARDLLSQLENEGLLEWTDYDDYVLIAHTGDLRGVERAVYLALSDDEPRDIQQLSDALGREPASLRPVLRRMVEGGSVRPTAPATSRHRRYLRLPIDDGAR